MATPLNEIKIPRIMLPSSVFHHGGATAASMLMSESIGGAEDEDFLFRFHKPKFKPKCKPESKPKRKPKRKTVVHATSKEFGISMFQ